MHWAAQYIGTPWQLGATGPDAYDCWGLVRHVQRQHFGREMPALTIGQTALQIRTPEQWRTLRELLAHTPWRCVAGKPGPGDIALMRTACGPHVGVCIEADGAVGVLHATGVVDRGGAVVYSRANDLHELGYGRIEYWRHCGA